MYSRPRKLHTPKALVVFGLIAALLIQGVPRRAEAATFLGTRFDQIQSATAGDTTTHVIGLTMLNTTTPVASISLEFCANTPTPNTPCTQPAGFDALGAVLSAQGGNVGFSINGNSTINRIVLTRTAGNPTNVLSTYQFDNIINPSNVGSYYVRLQTYSSNDATGPDIEEGGVAFAINSGLNVTAEVPPYLKFCVAVTIASFDCSTATSFFIDIGELLPTAINKASSQFVAATNAQSGYSVTLNGTTLISGTNVIPALSSPTGASAGVSQFGLNLKANTVPGVGSEVVGPGIASAVNGYNFSNQYKFQSGDIIVSANDSSDNSKFTVSYIADVSNAQPAGVYATTISYICLANF